MTWRLTITRNALRENVSWPICPLRLLHFPGRPLPTRLRGGGERIAPEPRHGAADTRDRPRRQELFNAGTFENDLKWPPWDGDWGNRDAHRARVRAPLAWCAAREIPIRGHVMVWPSFRHIARARKVERNPETLRAAVLNHIDDIAAATAADVREWDVVNAPWCNHDLMDLCGREVMVDFSTDDEELQADFQRDLMTLCFSHPAVAGFQFWGFWAGAHWKPECAMIARDWTERPNGAAYRALVFDRWWSRPHAATDAQGTAAFRVFKGRHTVTAEHGGVSRTVDVDASGDDAVVTVGPVP